MTGFQPSHQQWRPWLAFPHSGYWLTCHLTARLTRKLLQYMHKALLHGQCSMVPSGAERDLGSTENSRAIAFLMSTSGRLLQIIMSWAKRDLSSFSSTTLTAAFILITLQLLGQVLSFIFLIVNQKLTFPVSSLSSTNVLSSFLPVSLCWQKSFLIIPQTWPLWWPDYTGHC